MRKFMIFFTVIFFLIGCATTKPVNIQKNERIIYRDLTTEDGDGGSETEVQEAPMEKPMQSIEDSADSYILLICYIIFMVVTGVAGPIVI